MSDSSLFVDLVASATIGIVVYEWTAPPDLGSFRMVVENAAAPLAGSEAAQLGHTLDATRSRVLDTIVPEHLARTIETGEPCAFEVDLRIDGRGMIPFAVHCFRVGPRHASLMFEELSERRRLARELDDRMRALEASNRALDDFAYVASHDLKSPLRDIHNLASWIDEDLGDAIPPPTRRHLDTLVGRIARMERLLDDLLAYSRVAREGTAPRALSVREVVRNVIGLLAPTHHRIIVEGDADVVWARSAVFEQALRNLISNAIIHDDRPGGTITVFVRAHDGGTEVVVRDDGPGIAAAFRDRVFRVFQTLGGPASGTGIGLAIVKRAVESHNGSVTLDATERGCTFRTFWPAANGV